MLGSNWISSLLPATLITQADALLQGHKLEDAVKLADQQLKKIQGRVSVDQDEVRTPTHPPHSLLIPHPLLVLAQADELRYVYQRIGFQCLTETLFDDAGKHFFAGNLDPRVLISYYPELCGALFLTDDDVHVFAGVAEHMPPERSIDDISESCLARLRVPSPRIVVPRPAHS